MKAIIIITAAFAILGLSACSSSTCSSCCKSGQGSKKCCADGSCTKCTAKKHAAE